jgi:hypothetical protein
MMFGHHCGDDKEKKLHCWTITIGLRYTSSRTCEAFPPRPMCTNIQTNNNVVVVLILSRVCSSLSYWFFVYLTLRLCNPIINNQ